MNKNVLKIIDGARFVNTPTPPSQDEILEKIVLDTVRECLIQCRRAERWSADGGRKIPDRLMSRANLCISYIEEHFGVK